MRRSLPWLIVMLAACGQHDAAAPPPPADLRPPTGPSDPRPLDPDRWATLRPGEHAGYNERASLVQSGKLVYEKYCVGCHGEKGDGNGPASARLITRPRDFTKGIFKFRSTDSSSLPLETDLARTISRGLSRVSMPAFPLMPERDRMAVIEYLKSFYPKWDRDAPDRVIVPVPKAPTDLAKAERVARGRIVYVSMQCGTCHGDAGAGADTVFTDAWGNPQRPFDFTRGRLKSGDDPEDIYRTFHAGLISVMPSFGGVVLAGVSQDGFRKAGSKLEAGEVARLEPLLAAFPATGADAFAPGAPISGDELAERNSWDLVAYILSLRQVHSTRSAVIAEVRKP